MLYIFSLKFNFVPYFVTDGGSGNRQNVSLKLKLSVVCFLRILGTEHPKLMKPLCRTERKHGTDFIKQTLNMIILKLVEPQL